MNVKELRAEMVRKSYTQQMLADVLGLNVGTVSQKMLGKRQFTLIEIQKISKALGLTQKQRDAIFF